MCTLHGVYQYTLFDIGGVEIHSIECIEYCTKDQSNVKDVKDTLYGVEGQMIFDIFDILQYT